VRAYWCDASVILRLLIGKPEGLAGRAVQIFRGAERGAYRLLVHPVTVAEVFYTLKSYYKVPVPEIANAIAALCERDGVELMEEHAVVRALEGIADAGASFADALLAALAVQGGEGVATFDQDFRGLGVEMLGVEP